jgi:hypothetical protein
MPRFRTMTPGAATYDHATAVADILAGYHRTELALRRGDKPAYVCDRLAEADKPDCPAGTDPARPN